MRTLLLAITLFCSTSILVQAQREAIQDYDVVLRIQTDGSLEVTETIRVSVTGDQIKRGITRAFPLRSKVEDQRARNQSYDIISVRRDGMEEDYHTSKGGGNLTLYAGRADVFLNPGTYTYEITYRSPNQVYFTPEVDEISWTAIGTENSIPVIRASVEVRTPAGVTPTQWSCYTGPVNARESNCSAEQTGDVVRFNATQQLIPGHGMTVAVGWPSGVVNRPPPPSWGKTNGGWLVGLLGILGALFYGFNSWQRYGQDPPSPPVRIQFAPPEGLSPASVGYIATGFPSENQMIATLVSLTQKGFMEITEEEKKGIFTNSEMFVLHPCGKIPSPDELTPEEQAVYDHLLDDQDVIELNGSYNSKLAKAFSEHQQSLRRQHRKFLNEGNNAKKILPLVGILLPAIGLTALLAKWDTTGYAFPAIITLGAGLVVGLPVFAWLIRKPTPEKLQLRAEIKGLKEYFSLSKEEHRRTLNAPEMTEEHYLSMLPYAMALGVSNNWSADLASDLLSTMEHQLYYAPTFHKQFRAQYSSTATQASSGGSSSGGGGSVGSGGGGGGVGGW
ncbi:DUF2207 domain-containing protein [Lewinella sp. W8]|uniref:DUF2207 domain-containing protein n=1 Tax=Lewinella sp. W8 TaxID=2528208 RepID=UPI001067D083|nr:DUF2207 domain-containing protein [Lewinella sp. W8]MTB52964.1 DUF2207 domain-containing protein [Lewinella sp. W8]